MQLKHGLVVAHRLRAAGLLKGTGQGQHSPAQGITSHHITRNRHTGKKRLRATASSRQGRPRPERTGPLRQAGSCAPSHMPPPNADTPPHDGRATRATLGHCQAMQPRLPHPTLPHDHHQRWQRVRPRSPHRPLQLARGSRQWGHLCGASAHLGLDACHQLPPLPAQLQVYLAQEPAPRHSGHSGPRHSGAQVPVGTCSAGQTRPPGLQVCRCMPSGCEAARLD